MVDDRGATRSGWVTFAGGAAHCCSLQAKGEAGATRPRARKDLALTGAGSETAELSAAVSRE
jgi:hypothetical protein